MEIALLHPPITNRLELLAKYERNLPAINLAQVTPVLCINENSGSGCDFLKSGWLTFMRSVSRRLNSSKFSNNSRYSKQDC